MNKIFKKIYKDTKENYEEHIKSNLKNSKKTFIVTANPETLMIANNNHTYKKILLEPYIEIIPDGIGIIKAGKLLGYDFKERIPGIDLATFLLEEANIKGYKLYLFGSREEVINKITSLIQNKYPNINLVGAKNGYTNDSNEVFKDMKSQNPDIVLVALGIPLQEELIHKYYKNFNKGIFIGVGGTLDVLSGTKKRAPKLFIKLNLEWLYRIIKEPRRIKRFYNNNIKFIFKIRKLQKEKKGYSNQK